MKLAGHKQSKKKETKPKVYDKTKRVYDSKFAETQCWTGKKGRTVYENTDKGRKPPHYHHAHTVLYF